MATTKNLCAQISLDLHQKISEAREAAGLTTAQYITELLTEFTNMLFPFEGVELAIGKLAMWRIQTHGQFGGTWLSDYVPNRLGGFVQEQRPQKPQMELLGQDGNIFGIMGRASRLLKRAGMKEQSDEMISRVTACGDYNKALNIISEYVETELSPRPEPQKSQKKKGRNAHER